MAVYSDVDMKDALRDGSISIQGFDERFLSPDSYDLGVDDIWEVVDPWKKEDILRVHWSLGGRGLNTEYRLPRLHPRELTPLKGSVLKPRRVYIAACTSRINTRSPDIKVRVVPKSGRARDGLYVFNPHSANYVAIVPYVFLEPPEGKIAQAVIYEKPTYPLKTGEMRHLLEQKGMFSSSQHFREDERGNGYVPMTFDAQLKVYDSGCMVDMDKRRMFPRNGHGMFHFHLGITNESFGTGPGCVLWMLSREGCIYPNAPLVHANTGEQHHTLEVSLTQDEASRILTYKKPPYACSVRAYPLKTPTNTQYKGGYNGQIVPLPRVPLH